MFSKRRIKRRGRQLLGRGSRLEGKERERLGNGRKDEGNERGE